MDIVQIVVLAVLQGLTEFLPISSSAHLILVPHLTGWPDQGLAFDVAVHVGTLSAVLVYYRHSVVTLTLDWLRSVKERRMVGESKLAWGVLVGTIPVGLAGLLLSDLVASQGRSLIVIGVASIAFGVLLGWADWTGKRERSESSLSWRDVMFIGCAQAIALIPGTSRSGITMTAALMLGLTREAAARFSFLLSIPVIVLAGLLETRELIQSETTIVWSELLLGALISGVSAYLCIAAFLKFLERIGMMPFVIYRVILGLILFGFSAA